ncbi:MAG: 30S ribosomal protein S20 [Planctomycetota bacterium]
MAGGISRWRIHFPPRSGLGRTWPAGRGTGRNRARKGVVKTQIRKFTDAVRARDVDQAQAEFRGVVKKLDQTAAKGTLHKNTVARKKSRLAKQLNKLTAAQQG